MSDPTAKELLEQIGGSSEGPWVSASLELASRVEKVLALHSEYKGRFGSACKAPGCDNYWPCPTVRILNGEKQ